VSETVAEYCRSLLESPGLEEKLRPPPDGLTDKPAPAIVIDAPARDDVIGLADRADRLPKLGQLTDRHARAVTLERFAHHELLAVELFAWALLAFPELPTPLRRGFLLTLAEEQTHLRHYLGRLSALDSGLGDGKLSDYLWRHVPAIMDSTHPAASFLCVMGLTFEQANLDFSALYADAFTRADDEESAAVMRLVYEDEIGHVALAARWLPKLAEGTPSDLDAYERHVPFPLGASRAKARRFDAEARRRAGLSEAFIEHVRHARPSYQTNPQPHPKPHPKADPGASTLASSPDEEQP